MSQVASNYVAEVYAPRAQNYVESTVHSTGDDLDQIEAVVKGMGQARVLDLGCGGGHVSYRAAPHVASVVAYDLTQTMLDAVARTAAERGFGNIETRQGPAEKLPFPDASFDAVLCRFTTHHWSDMEAGLREARRVLKPGARAAFADCIAPSGAVLDTHLQTVELLRDPSHVRNYSAAEWLSALARSGFAVESTTARKLRMIFPSWTARTGVPEAYQAIIRSVQAAAPEAVKAHFDIDAEGNFDLDTMVMIVRAA